MGKFGDKGEKTKEGHDKEVESVKRAPPSRAPASAPASTPASAPASNR